jgi:uncharacterized protein
MCPLFANCFETSPINTVRVPASAIKSPRWRAEGSVFIKLGNEREFYDLLNKQAATALKCAEQFLELVRDFGNLPKYAKLIEDLEHEGDELTLQLQTKVASTFITPLDKEDLRELSQTLDDVTDYVEAAVARVALYKLDKVRADLDPLAELLLKCVKVVVKAVAELVGGLQHSGVLPKLLREIHEIEDDSDQAFRSALANLFDEPGIDPLMVIKWKEIFDRVEQSIDKCEDVSKILGTILVKYA